MTNYLIIDTETTGVRPHDRIVEVAWRMIDGDFNTLDQGHSLINPLMPIPSAASAVHGITNSDVADAPTADEYFNDILGNKLGVSDFVFVAHNSEFDYRFLQPYIPEGTAQMCTLRLARKIFPNAENHKLATLVYELDLPVDRDRFHSADGDIEATAALLVKMSEVTGRTLWDLFEYANEPIQYTVMTFGKHKGTALAELPKDYVHWLLTKADNLDPDLRASLEAL